MAKKRNDAVESIVDEMGRMEDSHNAAVDAAEASAVASQAATGSNGEGGTEAGKPSAPRNRTDSEYWLVATDPMDGTVEFLLNAPTVGQGRKLRIRMMGTPMARGRKIRLARVTYVEG